MPLDSVTLSALAEELRPRLVGARVDKVQQPERDTVLLSVHGRDENFRLTVCGGVGNARVHITAARYENPAQPPMFCMLLRKHLTGARIAELDQPQRERILLLHFDARDEMGAAVRRTLVGEFIGRGTNLILINGEGCIIDCLRRVDAEMSALRQVLPGLRYRLPLQQSKPDFFSLNSEERRTLWANWDRQTPPDKWLLNTFSALSPLLCREMVWRCGGDMTALPAQMDALCASVENGTFTPFMLLQDGKPKDFSCFRIGQYENAMECETFPGFSALLDAFYTRRSQMEELRRRTQSLRRTVKTARDRAQRKCALQTEELARTANREQKRRWGDLITANLYRAPKPGAAEMTVEDFYTESCPMVTVPLDPRKTAQANAAAYYKEYAKAKTAERYLTELLEQSRRDARYLESVLDELERVSGEADVAEIRRELEETGYLRTPKQKSGKRPRERESAPLRYRSSGGYEILVGRSNRQNDQLTGKIAHKGDLWFHTQKIHGSHVILRCAGADPDAQSIREAAALAATHSQAASGGKVAVDYTRVKLVKKPAGELPGMVIYSGQTTVIAEADAALAERLKTD
ncbi:MAG: NFACT family protein [Oscillospiraceae bacterium]|nr:NFACT family protein [Oscillospiraceae bacterium]